MADLIGMWNMCSIYEGSGKGYSLTKTGSPTFGADNGYPLGINCADVSSGNMFTWVSGAGDIGDPGDDIVITGWGRIDTEVASSWYTLFRSCNEDTDRCIGVDYQYNGGTRRLRWYKEGYGSGASAAQAVIKERV